jgi:hypothetical protein
MIFVSVNPFALKRFFFFFLTAIGLSCISCYGQSILLSVQSTPYDKQMTRIRPFLTMERPSNHSTVSLRMVNHWIWDLRSIPYGFTREWKTPAETESGGPADCKAKAVALYQRMQANGAGTLRLVIGKHTLNSRSTHAWLEWETQDGSYLLDPTLNWQAYRLGDLGRGSYIPFYAFEGGKKYRAAQPALIAQN